MSKMLKTHQNTIGNLAIALLFVGGCIFMLTGSWDTSETEAAKGCCGGDTTVTGGCCGSANQLSGSGSYNCNCLDTDNAEADCGDCEEDPDNEDSECGGTADTKGCQTEDPGCTDSCESNGYCDSNGFGDPVCPNDRDYDEERGICDGTPRDDGTCFNNSE